MGTACPTEKVIPLSPVVVHDTDNELPRAALLIAWDIHGSLSHGLAKDRVTASLIDDIAVEEISKEGDTVVLGQQKNNLSSSEKWSKIAREKTCCDLTLPP